MKIMYTLGITALLICSIITGCSVPAANTPAKTPKTKLVVAIVPEESPAAIIKKNEKLKEYLIQSLNMEVELLVTTDYSSMIEAMRKGHVDIGLFGPLSYVLLKQKMPNAIPFAAKTEKGLPTYESVFVVNADSGIKTLADVKGKNIAFSDPASTSYILWQERLLKGAGYKIRIDYNDQFLGAHDALLIAVQNGNAQAGATTRPNYNSLVEKGTIKSDKVKILDTAQPIPVPNHPWVMNPELDPVLKEKIKKSFYELKNSEVLKPLKAEGFVAVTDSDYDIIRNSVQVLGINLEESKK